MRLSFGIKTTPAHVDYADIVRVWQEADEIEEIEHAWLYDHLLPRVGPGPIQESELAGPVYEGWTLLAALAAQTRRLRLGLMVTNNRIRRPAVLAKMAATVDVISGGRLEFGLGIGGFPRRDPRFETMVAPEYKAYGIEPRPWTEAVADFAESCEIIRRLWTEEVFDYTGRHHRLRAARCNPKPVQRPHPPFLVAGAGQATLGLVADHADIWNVIGPPVNPIEALRRHSTTLDELCIARGRDPREITRSAQIVITYDNPDSTRNTLRQLATAGFTHLVLSLPSPYPRDVAHWVADELIIPVRRTLDGLPPR
ncbi:LLM class flavin-dependent oxidoreductase [Nocardia pseudobrasiliensis]|nr:LLM class flavin-dependent oxidoreductase [Nocardia pseudobrasiliensis]